MVFFNLRQRTDSIQGLVVTSPGIVSKQMVKWAATLADESIVLVGGTVQLPKEEVKSASVGNVEILISQVC
jgi:aspartyl-tRNA synthetase